MGNYFFEDGYRLHGVDQISDWGCEATCALVPRDMLLEHFDHLVKEIRAEFLELDIGAREVVEAHIVNLLDFIHILPGDGVGRYSDRGGLAELSFRRAVIALREAKLKYEILGDDCIYPAKKGSYSQKITGVFLCGLYYKIEFILKEYTVFYNDVRDPWNFSVSNLRDWCREVRADEYSYCFQEDFYLKDVNLDTKRLLGEIVEQYYIELGKYEMDWIHFAISGRPNDEILIDILEFADAAVHHNSVSD